MASNPMQRKARVSFLMGMFVTLLITGVIIAGLGYFKYYSYVPLLYILVCSHSYVDYIMYFINIIIHIKYPF